MIKKTIVIIGAGGLAREVKNLIEDINRFESKYEFLGYLVSDLKKLTKYDSHDEILGEFDWLSEHKFDFNHRVDNRDAVFEAVAKLVRDLRVLCLEFGVFEGASMQYWSHSLKHPETKLHGFDSFEGLAEDFGSSGPYPKGTFNVSGVVPEIDDNRVRFFKGWFDQVLPTYSVPKHDVLVITMDADLYSSTICVLRYLRPYIKAGTFIYFDDMSRPEHEPRAFAEFMEESGLRFQPVCADQSLNCVFFQCVES